MEGGPGNRGKDGAGPHRSVPSHSHQSDRQLPPSEEVQERDGQCPPSGYPHGNMKQKLNGGLARAVGLSRGSPAQVGVGMLPQRKENHLGSEELVLMDRD